MNFLLISFGAGVAAPPCTGACGDAGADTVVTLALLALLIAWPVFRPAATRLWKAAAKAVSCLLERERARVEARRANA